jgi:hypothetical protein
VKFYHQKRHKIHAISRQSPRSLPEEAGKKFVSDRMMTAFGAYGKEY